MKTLRFDTVILAAFALAFAGAPSVLHAATPAVGGPAPDFVLPYATADTIVTDQIDRFTEKGIKLKSGQELEADIVVCATGLELQLFGGMQLTVDGKPYETTKAMNYKGMMFSDLPNLSNTMGYTNASWTLKADLIAEYVCRLIKHMDKTGTKICVPRNNDPSVQPTPFLDMTSGYFQRALDRLPKQGNKAPWKLYQNYAFDMTMLRRGKVNDGVMQFERPHRVVASATAAPSAVESGAARLAV